MGLALQRLWKRLVALRAPARSLWKPRLPRLESAFDAGRAELARDRVRVWLSQTPFQP
jgi:hypothetical protein